MKCSIQTTKDGLLTMWHHCENGLLETTTISIHFHPNHLQVSSKDNTFSSVVLRPWVLDWPGIKPVISSTAFRCFSNSYWPTFNWAALVKNSLAHWNSCSMHLKLFVLFSDLGRLSNLERLDCRHNQLTNVPLLTSCQSLKVCASLISSFCCNF